MARQTSLSNAQWFQNRIIYLSIFIQLLLLTILARLWFLQIVSGHKFEKRAKANRVRIIPLKAPRGLIFDRENRLLVNNRPVYTVSIIPQGVQKLEQVTQELAGLLKMPQDMIDAKIRKQRRRPFQPVKLVQDVDLKTISVLAERKSDFPGVIIETEYQRSYIYQKLAAHLLGYVGEISESLLELPAYKGFYPGDLIGQTGLEKTLDRSFQGIAGGKQVEVDALGRELRTLLTRKPLPGQNVSLTIDLDLQKAAAAALGSLTGAVVALDPRNGDVLAMVSRPAFDPNLFAGRIDPADWQRLNNNPLRPLVNRVISSHYPPGSTFKPLTAMVALEAGAIAATDSFYCNGSFHLGSLIFRCWKEAGHGTVDLEEAIINSCNIFFYHSGQRTGIDDMSRFASSFLMGRLTGISLPNEVAGVIPSPDWKRRVFNQPWYPGDTLQFSIGQGEVLLTPLQLANTFAAIANGGTVYQPKLVREIRTVDGQLVESSKPKVLEQLKLSQTDLEAVRLAMWKVVNRFGTGRRSYIRGADISGKTGTAQVAGVPYDEKKKEETPQQLRPHSWFVSFAPYKEPRIVLVVLVENGGEGSSNAAPVAKKFYDEFFKDAPLDDLELIEKYRDPYIASWAKPLASESITELAAPDNLPSVRMPVFSEPLPSTATVITPKEEP